MNRDATSRADLPRIVPVEVAGETFIAYPERIRAHAALHPNQLAIVEGETRITWGELTRDVDCMAAALMASGFQHGDVLGILGESVAAYVVAYLAGLAAGGCVAPLPAMVADGALSQLIGDSEAKILLVSQSQRERVQTLLGEACVDGIVRMGFDFGGDGWINLAKQMTEAPVPASWPPIGPEDLFNIIYSSGTTGTPKGIVHDHLFRFRQIQGQRDFGLNHEKTVLISTVMYSNTTLVSAIAALGNGSTLVMMSKFSVDGFFDIVERWRPTHGVFVPVQIQRILAHPRFATADLSSFEVKSVTSAPFPTEVKRRAATEWPGKLFEMYGMTEGGVATALDTSAFPEKMASVGKPGKNIVIKLIDDNNREVAQGEIGEVVGRSPMMMRGYHRRPDLTAKFLVQLDDGLTYFRSGDLGCFDEDGFLSIVGRAKDVIISGGLNIYATDLEEVLLSHADVLEAAVIGVASQEWGETPVGYIVPRGQGAVDTGALLDLVNGHLGKNQRLKEVRVVAELPRNALGKVVKADLRKLYEGTLG